MGLTTLIRALALCHFQLAHPGPKTVLQDFQITHGESEKGQARSKCPIPIPKQMLEAWSTFQATYRASLPTPRTSLEEPLYICATCLARVNQFTKLSSRSSGVSQEEPSTIFQNNPQPTPKPGRLGWYILFWRALGVSESCGHDGCSAQSSQFALSIQCMSNSKLNCTYRRYMAPPSYEHGER